MFMTRKITFILKNKVADMVIILCVERLQDQSSCSKSDFFLASILTCPWLAIYSGLAIFIFFQGQCMGPTRADWSRPICFRCCCRGSGILWTEIQGGLSTSKARYMLIHFCSFCIFQTSYLYVGKSTESLKSVLVTLNWQNVVSYPTRVIYLHVLHDYR